jgi:hypothetical protein
VKRPPTDFELLHAIYERYRGEFANYVEDDAEGRASKVFVPIDIPELARVFGVDADSIFGRLYFHLNPLYAPEDETKFLFSPKVGSDRNCVNFPLLEAVLAGLWEQRRRDTWALTIAIISLGIAGASLIVSLVAIIAG